MPTELREILAQRITDAGGRLTVRSALNPALWMCAIVSFPSLLLQGYAPNPPWWLGLLVGAPVITAIVGFVYLLIFDRDKLQSENFQIRKRTLDLIEQKGDIRSIDASTLQAIANPEIRYLSHKQQGDGE